MPRIDLSRRILVEKKGLFALGNTYTLPRVLQCLRRFCPGESWRVHASSEASR
ncbi:unnamed protein product [Fusarium graminearum]|nr:unnamed protein product [Fusarium graminearum]CAG1963826.1 unnamed protein product [Fusarium graminearum]CAG1982758.1 unnamed protein product [Fusarium graminearum]VTO82031.1 unnamed protein product [Fusarium graminearum]